MVSTTVIPMLGTIALLLLMYALIRGLCVSANSEHEISSFKSLPKDLRIVSIGIALLLGAIIVVGNVAGPPTRADSKGNSIQKTG
jgi:hypothetical protein